MFIGYAEKSIAFKLLDEETHAVMVSRDAVLTRLQIGLPTQNFQ